MIEYAFILAFIAVVMVVAVAALGIATRRPFENTAGVLGGDSGSADANGESPSGGRAGKR